MLQQLYLFIAKNRKTYLIRLVQQIKKETIMETVQTIQSVIIK